MTNAAAVLRTRILVVEDDADARAIYEGTLRWAGYEVVTATSITAARRAAESTRPDLVILDCMLPDGRGVELLRAWRQCAAMARVPVVVVTAFAEDSDVRAAVAAGVDGLLVKPCWGRTLLKKLASVLERGADSRVTGRRAAARPRAGRTTLAYGAATDDASEPGDRSEVSAVFSLPASPREELERPRPAPSTPEGAALQLSEDGKLQACCVRCLRCSPMLGRDRAVAQGRVADLGWAWRQTGWWCPVCIERGVGRGRARIERADPS